MYVLMFCIMPDALKQIGIDFVCLLVIFRGAGWFWVACLFVCLFACLYFLKMRLGIELFTYSSLGGGEG